VEVTSIPANLRERLSELRAVPLRDWVDRVVEGYREYDLLTFASAIAFRVFFAIVPLLLFAFGLMGFLDLSSLWREDIGPDVRSALSPELFRALDDSITRVLTGKQLFWTTAGAAIAVWEVSGAVRITIKAMNRIYGAAEKRSVTERFALSIGLAAAVTILVLLTIASVKLSPYLVDELFGASLLVAVLSFVARWAIAIVLLLTIVGLLVRAGPDKERPLIWVTYGAALVVVSWIAISVLFGLYLAQIAHYGSIFGNLATVFVVIEYVFLSSIVFITGILVDSLTRGAAEGGRGGA
jgi:membrane protein